MKVNDGAHEAHTGHSQDVFGAMLAYIIIEITLSFFSLFNNLLVLVAIYKFKKLQTSTYRLIGSLAAADIAVALFANPSGIVLRTGMPITPAVANSTIDHPTVSQSTCSLFMSAVLFFTQVSIFNLLAIAIDRYIAIYHSLRYKAIVTPLRIKVAIAVTWVLGALIGVVPHLAWYAESCYLTNSSFTCAFEEQIILKYMIYWNFFTFMLLPLAIMFILYYFIFKSAKKQLRKIYADVLSLNKKSKSSISSLKDIFKIKENFQKKGKTKKPSLRMRIFFSSATRGARASPSTNGVSEANESTFDTYSTSSDAIEHQNTDGLLQKFPTEDGSGADRFINRTHSLGNSSITSIASGNTSVKNGDRSRGEIEGTSRKDTRKASIASSISITSTLNQSDNEIKKKKLKRKSKLLKKEFRAARSLLLVVGVFAFCWLPLHIHNAIHYFNPSLSLSVWYADFAILLSHANSLMNPIIYAFQLSDMKVAFRKLFKQICNSIKNFFCCFSLAKSHQGKRLAQSSV